MNKDNNVFIMCMIVVSIMLLTFAFTNVNKTFAFDNTKNKEFDVAFSDISVNTMLEDYKIDSINNKISFYVNMGEFGEKFKFASTIKNDGGYDAYLHDIKVDDLKSMYVATSSDTNKDYFVSDYINMSINYTKNNNKNNVVRDSNVTVGDLLKKNTRNEVEVSLRFKNEDEISEDAIKALENKRIALNMDVILNYLQK